jgi:hypothetical protein
MGGKECFINKASIMLITIFLLMGIMTPVNAQRSFTVISSKDPSTFYLENTRITKYVKSGILDGWVKKVITEKERTLKKNNAKKLSKQEKAKEKEINELLKKTSYQLMHLQFDAINFRYKVLESYSYNKESQLLSSETSLSDWVLIPIDSVEEQIMNTMTEYIQNNIDQVMMK